MRTDATARLTKQRGQLSYTTAALPDTAHLLSLEIAKGKSNRNAAVAIVGAAVIVTVTAVGTRIGLLCMWTVTSAVTAVLPSMVHLLRTVCPDMWVTATMRRCGV